MTGKRSKAGSESPKKQVISASRRTDIPAFYMKWFMEGLRKGEFHVENPYSRQTFTVPVSPENTETFVFWSKNFGPFLDGRYGEALRNMGYHLFFNYTVNSVDRLLEPHVPELDTRLRHLDDLCRRFGPETVSWRFDPICHYILDGKLRDNLKDFRKIADCAAKSGVRRCITSFADLYGKVLGREKRLTGFSFVDPSDEEKKRILLEMNEILTRKSMVLYLCCEKNIFQHLPLGSGIEPSACIPNPLLEKLSGARLSHTKDGGQRKSKGCGCYVSKDIGSYRFQPCFHNCLFCYANPEQPENQRIP
jgi:hypothetical protein